MADISFEREAEPARAERFRSAVDELFGWIALVSTGALLLYLLQFVGG